MLPSLSAATDLVERAAATPAKKAKPTGKGAAKLEGNVRDDKNKNHGNRA